MTNAAWIRIFNTHTGAAPPPDCTDLYLMLATRVVALIVFPNPAIAAQFHNALDGQWDGKGSARFGGEETAEPSH